MKNLLKVEELFLFGLALFLFSGLEYAWWLYALLFLTPDLSMLGYLANPRVFGYGLKYSDAFQNTHLGRIGR